MRFQLIINALFILNLISITPSTASSTRSVLVELLQETKNKIITFTSFKPSSFPKNQSTISLQQEHLKNTFKPFHSPPFSVNTIIKKINTRAEFYEIASYEKTKRSLTQARQKIISSTQFNQDKVDIFFEMIDYFVRDEPSIKRENIKIIIGTGHMSSDIEDMIDDQIKRNKDEIKKAILKEISDLKINNLYNQYLSLTSDFPISANFLLATLHFNYAKVYKLGSGIDDQNYSSYHSSQALSYLNQVGVDEFSSLSSQPPLHYEKGCCYKISQLREKIIAHRGEVLD